MRCSPIRSNLGNVLIENYVNKDRKKCVTKNTLNQLVSQHVQGHRDMELWSARYSSDNFFILNVLSLSILTCSSYEIFLKSPKMFQTITAPSTLLSNARKFKCGDLHKQRVFKRCFLEDERGCKNAALKLEFKKILRRPQGFIMFLEFNSTSLQEERRILDEK